MEYFQRITSFKGSYYFLSNFYPQPVHYQEREYATAEHAYQAAKAADTVGHDSVIYKTVLVGGRPVQALTTAGEAKRAGRKVQMREDWENVKLDVMYQILKAKFAPGSECAALLEATGEAALVEGNYWNDTFWGVCKGVGENWLGKLLMRVRTENREFVARTQPA